MTDVKKHLLTFITLFSIIGLNAQKYVGQKSFVGATIGTLSYTGMYSKGTGFVSHTSMSGSAFYSRRILLPTQLYLRGELMMGEIAGNNLVGEEESAGRKGGFRGYLFEASLKGEYDIFNLYEQKFSPYIIGGAGGYLLFDYEPKQGNTKALKERIGFVVPVGAGIKYKLYNRIRVFAEGAYRFFPHNIDNLPDKTIHNPNNYYSIVVGATFALQAYNRLW